MIRYGIDQLLWSSGRIIEIISYFKEKGEALWKRLAQTIRAAYLSGHFIVDMFISEKNIDQYISYLAYPTTSFSALPRLAHTCPSETIPICDEHTRGFVMALAQALAQ
jgi:hypothetical protein